MTFTLLNTRPAHQAEALNELVVKQGGISLNCPTLTIAFDYDAVQHFVFPNEIDKVIFVSVNAVNGLLDQSGYQKLKSILSSARFYAIGKATTEQGIKKGLAIQHLSEQRFDSESLLSHPQMQNVQGQTVLLVKGENGRELIAETLTRRGASVLPLIVYKRQPAPFCKDNWQCFLRSENPILLITSLASWHSLLQSVSITQDIEIESEEARVEFLRSGFWANIRTIVVMSQRIAEQLKREGCLQPIRVVETQSNQGIIDAII